MLIRGGLAALALLLIYRHFARSGASSATAGLVALLALGSGLFFQVLPPRDPGVHPGTTWNFFAFTTIVAALSLTYWLAERDRQEAQVYGRLDWRWFAPVALLVMAIVQSPATFVLVLPVLAAVPALERRGARWRALLGVGIALMLLGVFWLGVRAAFQVRNDLSHLLDPRIIGWSLVDLIAGRNFGVLVWFAPVVLLVASFRRETARGWLLASVGIATLLLAFQQPHGPRFVEGTPVSAFLPLYAACWFVPARVPRPLWLILTAILAGLIIWPAWSSPLDTGRTADRPWSHRYALAHYLPYETTREHVPFYSEWRGTGVKSRSLSPGLTRSERGPALVPSAGPAELMIASEKPLEAVLIDFGPEARTDLRVEGGELGNTVFRPDGGVRFEIVLGEPDRVHPMWFSPKPHSIYLLEIEMPGAPDAELPVSILARPEDALPRSLDPSTAGREP